MNNISKWKLLFGSVMAVVLMPVFAATSDEAITMNTPAVSPPSDVVEKTVMDEADALFTAGKHDLAIDTVENYLLQNPDSTVGWGKSCLWNLQDSLDANMLTEANISNTNANSQEAGANNVSPTAKVATIADALLDKAKYSCERFVELAPSTPEAHFYLSNIFMAKKWYVHAFWHIKRGLTLTADINPSVSSTNSAQEGSMAKTESMVDLANTTNITELVEAAKHNKYYLLDRLGDYNVSIEAKLPDKYVEQQENFLQDGLPADELNFVALSAKIEQAPTVAAGYYNRALFGLHNYSSVNVESDFNKVIELSPKWFAGYSGLAVYYIQNKNYKEAKALLDQAKALNADDTTTKFNANLLQMFNDAVIAYTIEELVNIKNAVAANEDNLRSFDETLANMAGYLRRDPTSAELYEAYGDIYAQAKSQYYRDSSARYYQKAIQLGGDAGRINAKLDKAVAVQAPAPS